MQLAQSLMDEIKADLYVIGERLPPMCEYAVALIQRLAPFGVDQLLEKLLITIGNTEALSMAVRQCVRRRGLGMRSSPNRRRILPVANAVEPIGQNGQ